MPTIFESPKDLLSAVSNGLGASEWMSIDQTRLDQFAEATGDH
ncbi:MAG: dehydratase, partial [bacterium]|nr:dehydratase [bacterium]